jgi:hypothetical protein
VTIAVAVSARGAVAAVKSASSDGEATVYLSGAFSTDFDVAYRAVLKPGAHNQSWSSLSILLVGSKIPGPGASVGVASDPSHHGSITSFTYVVYPNLKEDYEVHSVSCTTGCLIELRGDAYDVYAYVNGKQLATWSRSDLYLAHPSIQLNAESHGAGDVLDASLTPVRTTGASRALPRPTCAFTTRGIEPAGLTTLTFDGQTGDESGAFVNLSTGAHGDKC